MREKIEKIIFIITIIILSIIMTIFINKKEGFHEDEIFSYGSSNYKLDNVYQRYGTKDALNKIIFDEILQGNVSQIISRINNYITNPDEYNKKMEELKKEEVPIWKTKEEAKEYVTIGRGDIFNYFSVYYNQVRDVHPPLFYGLVHFVSSIAYGHFSKYIIFSINIVFFILSCIEIRKILKLLNKKYLSIPAILLYGLNIGTISTVIFLRMYQMLVFFTLVSLKLHIEIIKNDLEINNKIRNKLIATTILGFLTQYYFCIFALIEFITLFIILLKNRKYNTLKKYFKYHLISAIIGVILFPAAIYHIFFSYRGVGASDLSTSSIERILTYFKEICYSFSIPEIPFLIIFGIILIVIIYKIIKKNLNWKITSIIGIPVIIYFLIVCKISPQMSETAIIRYITILIPIISIILILILNEILNRITNKKIVITFTILVLILIPETYGLIKNKPRYLYEGYNKIKQIAEENKEMNLVYIVDNNFTYMNAMPEFLIYNKTLIINYNEDNLDILKENDELKDEFILNIRKWMNYEEILREVLETSGYSSYEVLLDSNENESIIYKISK